MGPANKGHRQVMSGTWLAEEEGLPKVAGRRFLREVRLLRGPAGFTGHLDDDEVRWNRIGNAELVAEGWADDG